MDIMTARATQRVERLLWIIYSDNKLETAIRNTIAHMIEEIDPIVVAIEVDCCNAK